MCPGPKIQKEKELQYTKIILHIIYITKSCPFLLQESHFKNSSARQRRDRCGRITFPRQISNKRIWNKEFASPNSLVKKYPRALELTVKLHSSF